MNGEVSQEALQDENPAPEATAPDADAEPTFRNSIGMEFRLIPSGAFEMGYAGKKSDPDESPVHDVQISRPFYLGIYEVTQRQWIEVMGTRPWRRRTNVQKGSDYPAVFVNWNEVQAFIRRLNEREGGGYRLPTEAEWEYACRAGSSTKYSFGDEALLGRYAWYTKNAWDVGERYGHRVGRKEPNPWGLYDMHGNVKEWVADWYGAKYYREGGAGPVVDPRGPPSGKDRVIRGGSVEFLGPRASYRQHGPRTRKKVLLGFRVAKSLN